MGSPGWPLSSNVLRSGKTLPEQLKPSIIARIVRLHIHDVPGLVLFAVREGIIRLND